MPIPTAAATTSAASNKILTGTWNAQNKTTKFWIVIKIEEINHPLLDIPGTYTYKYSYDNYRDGTNGEKFVSNGFIGTDSISANNKSDAKLKATKGKAYIAAKNLLAGTISGSLGDPNPSADLATAPIPNTELDKIRWNPPPHFITRPPSFYTMANINGGSVKPEKTISAYGTGAALKLGKIYQNKTSAVALNKKASKLSPEQVTANLLWGFRFLYNPTSIKYGSTIDTQIDWMLQPKDPSNFFGGNTQVTVSVILNRIADMAALRKGGSVARDYPGGALSAEQSKGILKRGTEFDLEYLYRVVNGTPGNTSLTSDSTLKTSDFGYITGMPVWLQIHENMRYRASLAGIEVTHSLFTESMVPTFSVVNLTFIRYPELDRIGKVKKILGDLQDDLGLINTVETTDK